jgi:hypothetical protein
MEPFARRLFLPVLLATVVLTFHVVATTSISSVPREFPLGFARVLPVTYWIAVAFSVVLLFLGIARREKKCLLISAVLLTILIPGLGDLTQPHPRDLNTTIMAEYIARDGRFSPEENIFLNFPGAPILFSSLILVAGASPHLAVRSFGLLYNIVVLGLSYVFFRRAALGEIQSLLSALVVVACFYYQGLLIYTSLMGFVFYIAIAGIIFASRKSRVNYFLASIFFGAMVVSHAFSPFLTLAAVAGICIGWRAMYVLLRQLKQERFLGDAPTVTPLMLVQLLTILTAYWVYFAFVPFSSGVLKLGELQIISHVGLAGSPILSPQNPYAAAYSQVTVLYAPVLFLGFFAYLLLCRDGRKMQSILWILGLGGAVFISLAGYVSEFFARIFSFGILPLSYGVGRLHDSDKRSLRTAGIIILLAALALHLPAHYGQDAFLTIGDSTIEGIRFLANHSYSNASIDSPRRVFSWHFYVDIYRTWNANGPGSYYVLNRQAESLILYYDGQRALGELTQRVYSSQYDRVFSAGGSETYYENEF